MSTAEDALTRLLDVQGSGTDLPAARLLECAERALGSPEGEAATVMFTSGSTGAPKGIAFIHYHLVAKQFARAAALPSVGGDEILLCYLPLYHTFGRFLEMPSWRSVPARTGGTSRWRRWRHKLGFHGAPSDSRAASRMVDSVQSAKHDLRGSTLSASRRCSRGPMPRSRPCRI